MLEVSSFLHNESSNRRHLDLEGNRFVKNVFELQDICLHMIEGSRKVLGTRETRDQIITMMTTLVEETCSRCSDDHAEMRESAPASKAQLGRALSSRTSSEN